VLALDSVLGLFAGSLLFAQLRDHVIVGAVVLVGLALVYWPLLSRASTRRSPPPRGVPVRKLSVAIFLLLALTTAEAIVRSPSPPTSLLGSSTGDPAVRTA